MMALRRPLTAIVLVVLLIIIQQGPLQASSGPTVQDCHGHIQAAIRDFVSGQSSPIAGREEDSRTSIEEASDEEVHVEPEIELVPGTLQPEDSEEARNVSEEGGGSNEVEDETEPEVADTGTSASAEERLDNSNELNEPEVNEDESDEEQESSKEEEVVDDDSKEHDFQQPEVGSEDSSEAKGGEVVVEDIGTRDRRDAESSEVHAGQSEADDASHESQEETDESADATDSAEAGHGDVGDSSTDRSDKSEEGDADDQSEETTADGDDDVEEVIAVGPGELKPREPIETILGTSETEMAADDNRERVANVILKDVKKMYENAVKPLEQLYKFKDISNRHIGDAEIFSKPMILFMGPWSTGKSAIINYLLGTEYSRSALKTGAEPTSNSFTVLTYGETDQILDGTQIATDWAFSTLQKFGQTFLDRLKGRKSPNRLLQKMTIVDTPGIFENRKSTVAERQRFPLNDAFQWFIDRADLIYVVFDPSKLDVGPELEALFDQLKGRESHVRILLNKADMVRPSELMRVQATLLWNLSPEMGTSEAPPTVFVGSFWSRPYLPGSPVTLLDAQQEAFLEDLGAALDSRVETKVALARRHAVRVRNHAKMVDCYLKTYYDHKSFFGNRRKVADDIVDNPHDYHIYEGLSAMTNVSRYDLPDPDVYREFFRLHPLFDFKPLASTCSYFKGCPLDKLDIVIAYDMPELVGKYQKMLLTAPKPKPSN